MNVNTNNDIDKKSVEGILQTLQEILKNHGKEKEVKMESLFVEDLDLDSLDSVEMVMNLEDEYKIEIGDDKLQQMTVVSELVEHCYECCKKNESDNE